jgi:hypothetical protein
MKRLNCIKIYRIAELKWCTIITFDDDQVWWGSSIASIAFKRKS